MKDKTGWWETSLDINYSEGWSIIKNINWYTQAKNKFYYKIFDISSLYNEG